MGSNTILLHKRPLEHATTFQRFDLGKFAASIHKRWFHLEAKHPHSETGLSIADLSMIGIGGKVLLLDLKYPHT